MAEAENRMIEEAIAASGGNMVRAAEMLKVSPKTLKNRQRWKYFYVKYISFYKMEKRFDKKLRPRIFRGFTAP